MSAELGQLRRMREHSNAQIEITEAIDRLRIERLTRTLMVTVGAEALRIGCEPGPLALAA